MNGEGRETMTKIVLAAKPIEWTHSRGRRGCDWQEWHDNVYGFHIQITARTKEESPDAPYQAAWGEDNSEYFPTIEAAQQWCMDQINAWVREHVVVVPTPAQP